MLRKLGGPHKCAGGACIGLFPPPKSQQPWPSEWAGQEGRCSIASCRGQRCGSLAVHQPAQHRIRIGLAASGPAGTRMPADAGHPGLAGRRRSQSDSRSLAVAAGADAGARAATCCTRRCRRRLALPPPLLLTSVAARLRYRLLYRTLTLRGELLGHKGWVTAIAAPLDPTSETLLSSSR